MPIRPLVVLSLVLLSAAPVRAAVHPTASGATFTYTNAGATAVFLAGDFNGWNATALPMTRSGDVWSTTVPLSPGDHQYKFVVDGNWVADPENPRTAGDFANSVVTVGSGGAVAPPPSRAPTGSALNPKVMIDGRYLGTYVARRNELQGGEIVLDKPSHNMDVLFTIAVNENMDATLLTNANSSRENAEPWRTHLNFDRGSMALRFGRWSLVSYDNIAITSARDSLRTIGSVGIYRYPFGYNTIGASAEAEGPRGSRLWLLYSDRNADGERPGPAGAAVTHTTAPRDEGGFVRRYYSAGRTLLNENTAAAAVAAPLVRSLSAALIYRNARGSNRAALGGFGGTGDGVLGVTSGVAEQTVIVDTLTGARRVQVTQYSTMQERSLGAATLTLGGRGRAAWLAAGFGEERIDGLQSQAYPSAPADTSGTLTPGPAVSTKRRWDYARSFRVQAGAHGRWPAINAARIRFSVEHEQHRYDELAFGPAQATGPGGVDTVAIAGPLTNKRTTISMTATLPLGRVQLGVDVRDEIFRYAAGSPWGAQLWFSGANMWLDEHTVTVDRFTLLGGRAAAVVRPSVRVAIAPEHEAHVEYRGTIATPGLAYAPPFIETRLIGSGRLAPRVTIHGDVRVARYDAPALGLTQSYLACFTEVRYAWSEKVMLELGFGVDPWVLDLVPNEYHDIGRDLFLFAAGANENAARANYRRFGRLLGEAERSLERERRISLEAKMTF